MGRLRVALYHHLPPGGASRAMEELVARSVDQVEHVLFRIDPGPRDRHSGQQSPLDPLDLETHSLKIAGTPPGRLKEWAVTVPQVLRAERRIASMIDQMSFDAVVVHHQRYTHAPSLLTRISTPSAYFVHEPRRQSFEYELRPHDVGRGPLHLVSSGAIGLVHNLVKKNDIRATRAATRLMCNSHFTREYIWRAYGRDAVVVPLGVDLDRFCPEQLDDHAAGVPTADAAAPEVLMVAAIERPKGLDLAIRAVGTIRPDDRPRLRIVHNRADPTVRDELERLATASGVELKLEGDLSDHELIERYRRAALCLLTSRLEPLGLTAMEAAACGTPVVAVCEGGYRETVVDGATGLLADRDPEALGAAMSRVLTGEADLDPVTIRRTTEATRTWSRAVERYIDVVKRTAGSSPLPPSPTE